MTTADSDEILAQMRERAARLCQTLERQSLELATNDFTDQAIRDAGLIAIGGVIESLRRIAMPQEQATGAQLPKQSSPWPPGKGSLND